MGMGHDPGQARLLPKLGKDVLIGQNWAYNAGFGPGRNWTDRMSAWWDSEFPNWQWGKGSINRKEVNHYTQMMSNRTTKVGCGYTECAGGRMTKRFFVCNYQMFQMSNKYPYTKGE